MLAHIESSYKEEPSQADVANGSAQRPGYKLFQRIKAARATRNKEVLDKFLDGLRDDITWHCSKMRTEQAAELDAAAATSPEKASINSHRSSTGSSPLLSSAESHELDIRSSLPGETVSCVDTSSEIGDVTASSPPSPSRDPEESAEPRTATRSSTPVDTAPGTEEPPLYLYTSILYSHAGRTGVSLRYVPASSISLQGWRCEVIYDDIRRIGIAANKKNAGHVAARMICQELGIAA